MARKKNLSEAEDDGREEEFDYGEEPNFEVEFFLKVCIFYITIFRTLKTLLTTSRTRS